MTQVVPTSQSNERELKISDQLPPLPELYTTPSSPLRRRGSPVSSLVSTPENDPGSLEDFLVTGPPSPRFVESSQSQTEHEITSPAVNAMKARHEILMQSGRDHVLDISSSSPPRPTESQDYDANDEHSESQDSSHSFSFDSLPPRLSPGPVSQYTQSSASYGSYSETPSEVRAFVDMFKGRDEFGNELPAFAGNSGRSCSVSPSPTSQRLEGSSSEKGLQHTRSSSTSVSHSYARRSSEPTSHDSLQAVDAQDDAEGSQLDVSPSQEEDHPLDSSAIQVLPTPVRDFFAMFEESPSS
ncbi:hypothetical protein BD413DRAFT_475139 [Trametes elegans]|nr:hypothetical protein BD413DRAFT_475139 [Trametes elegans]